MTRTLTLISILLFYLSSIGQEDNNIIILKSDSNKIRLSEMMNDLQVLKEKDTINKNRDTIPFYYISKHRPYVRPKPLPIDTIAPLWTLTSFTGDTISLNNLKGRLVLLDFFYKGCHPCVEALPGLEALHQKYKDKGLTLIGIDPIDKLEYGILPLLAKKGVTYPVLSDFEGEAYYRYRPEGFPTLFLISREGKLIYIQLGIDMESEKRLEETIKNNL